MPDLFLVISTCIYFHGCHILLFSNKRNVSETDRSQTVTSTATAINGGSAGGSNSTKGFFRDLKRKHNSSSGTVLSSSNLGGEMADPFEQSGDASPRKMETTSSSSGHSSRSGDLGSEVISSTTTAASGLPPVVGITSGVGMATGGIEDDSGKSRGHISLGKGALQELMVY